MDKITAVPLAIHPTDDPQLRHSRVVFLEKVPTFPATFREKIGPCCDTSCEKK